MKRKNWIVFMITVILIFAYGMANAGKAVKIGEVVNIDRMGFQDDKITVLRINDPQNPFVSIYITQVKAGKWTTKTDPNNMSIACRLTGKIPLTDEGIQMINMETNRNIRHFHKSIGSKHMKIARWYDHMQNVLVYVVYTTKMYKGSSKHSLSVVPLN